MKTLHTTTTRNVTLSHKRVRLVLTIAGILTAILCSMALMQDVRSAEVLDAKAPRVGKLSGFGFLGFSGL